MIFNKDMDNYLKQITTSSKNNMSGNNNRLRILQGMNYFGEHFFYLEHNCCSVNSQTIINYTGEDLTQLEWDCNEIYINDSVDIIPLLQRGLLSVNFIKTILETEYSSQAFDVIMSLDEGEEFCVLPSVTIRFFAIRNNSTFIPHDISSLENFSQPVLIETVN